MNTKSISLIVILGLVALLAFFGFAKAQFADIVPIEIPIKLQIEVEVVYTTADDGSFGGYIAAPTGFTDVNITNDLVVDGLSTFTGTATFSNTTTLQEITFGDRYRDDLTFTAGATTTPGGLCSIQNTGNRRICSKVDLDVETAPINTFVFSAGTSTSASAWSQRNNGYGLISSSTVATSTPDVKNNEDDGNNGEDTWVWENSIYLLCAFDTLNAGTATGIYDNASSSDYADFGVGAINVTCHTE